MEPEARYTLVGTAVLALVVALAVAIAWIADTGRSKQTLAYNVYFARQSLEGLEVRSDVRMKGIRVGAVSGFAFSLARPGTVEVRLAIDPGTPVLQSTRAVVDRNLITGLANIRLVNASEDSPALAPLATGDAATIPEGESQLQQFSQSANQLVRRADETLQRINSTLSNEHQVAIGEALDGIRDLTRQTSSRMQRLDATLVAIGGAADSLRSAASGAGRDVHRLAERYDALGAEATSGMRELADAVRELRGDVRQLSSRTDDLLGSSDLELRLTARQLRVAGDEVALAARRLSDPRGALFGPSAASLGPGEGGR